MTESAPNCGTGAPTESKRLSRKNALGAIAQGFIYLAKNVLNDQLTHDVLFVIHALFQEK